MQSSPKFGEALYRVRDPRWVLSYAYRQVRELWDLISPSEFSALYRQVRGMTMCSSTRLRGLYSAVQRVVSQGIPGDLVECGTARGGSAALMGLTLKRLGAQRTLWVFDTFGGLPAPTEADPDFNLANRWTGSCIGTLEEVTASFERLGILAQTRFVKGLFQDTLPRAEVEKIAVLHIDGDWYESVKVCLENLYDKTVSGGVIQIDDYGFWKGACKAVEEFLAGRSIHVELKRLDYSGRQFIKP
jgi:hypothetical protein